MNKLDEKIDQFKRNIEALSYAIEQSAEDLEIREKEIQKKKIQTDKQREDMITKQNTILAQIDGMRVDRETADQKMRESIAMKKITDEDNEAIKTKEDDINNREIELEMKEKKIVGLIKREEEVKEIKELLTIEKNSIDNEKQIIQKEKELLDEKRQALDIRESKIEQREAKIQRIYKD